MQLFFLTCIFYHTIVCDIIINTTAQQLSQPHLQTLNDQIIQTIQSQITIVDKQEGKLISLNNRVRHQSHCHIHKKQFLIYYQLLITTFIVTLLILNSN